MSTDRTDKKPSVPYTLIDGVGDVVVRQGIITAAISSNENPMALALTLPAAMDLYDKIGQALKQRASVQSIAPKRVAAKKAARTK